MNCDFLKILKAACLSAAFLLSTPSYASVTSAYDTIKQKATELLLQKKKSQALQLILNYSTSELSRSQKAQAGDLLLKVAQQFTSKDAQEAYENSLNLTLENPKEALKSSEQCLTLDTQQLECLIQTARLQIRNKSLKASLASIKEIKELVPGSKFEVWLDVAAAKTESDFKNKQIIRSIPEKQSDDSLGLLILELDRSFKAKNYSRAKDLIIYFDKYYSDWPDLVFYRYRLDFESMEEKAKPIENNEQLTLYANKCKVLSKSLARKYRYDIELCMRTLN